MEDLENMIKPVLDTEEASSEGITNWVNPPKLSDLKQDLTDAKSSHDAHVIEVDIWLENLEGKGRARPAKVKGKSNVVPKVIRKQAEWRYASLSEPFLSTEDIFNTSPITFEDKEAAIQNGLVLNNQFNTKINKVKFIDDLVRTITDEGTVIIRTGWQTEEEIIQVPNMVPTPVTDPQQAQQLMGLAASMGDPAQAQALQAQMDPMMLQAIELTLQMGVPMAMVQDGLKDETIIIKNQPTVEICDYTNTIIDPTCRGVMDDAEFIIYSFETNLSALEKDGRYKNLSIIDLEGNSILGVADHRVEDGSNFNFTDKPRKKFVAYEYWGYWDFNNTGIVEPFVATWVGNTLIRMEENPFPDKKLPFVSAQYLPVRKSSYGQPDGYLLEDNQRIIGAVTRGMMDTMARSAVGQQGIRMDALDVTNRRRFDRGQDYEFNPAVDPRAAFHMHTFPEIPQSAPGLIEMQNNEAESLTGVKAFSSGISGQALGNTATGIRSALDATSKRELGILRRLAEAVKEVGRKMTSMNSEFLSEEEVIRITNNEFVVVKRDDLDGDIDIELTISTAEADNDKAEQQAFMLQTTAQTMGPEFSQLILTEIARLRNMPDLAEAIKQYKPEPDPLEVKKAELEIQLLEAQIYNEIAKGNENNANANLDNAKARTEGSNADNKDLEFVEREAGVTQERDLQKQGEQARANMQLEGVKHQYNMREKGADAAIEAAKPKPVSK